MILVLIGIAALVVSAPIIAAAIVAVASRREDAAWSLGGPGPQADGRPRTPHRGVRRGLDRLAPVEGAGTGGGCRPQLLAARSPTDRRRHPQHARRSPTAGQRPPQPGGRALSAHRKPESTGARPGYRPSPPLRGESQARRR
jgi:hypothetical protein